MCTVVIPAGERWRRGRELQRGFLMLTEGYLEIRISIKETVTVMTNTQLYTVCISISLNHLKTWSAVINPTHVSYPGAKRWCITTARITL